MPIPLVGGHELQNPVDRPERRGAAPRDLTHEVGVAQRLPAERGQTDPGAFDECVQLRPELLLQRLHARNGGAPSKRGATGRKSPTFQCVPEPSGEAILRWPALPIRPSHRYRKTNNGGLLTMWRRWVVPAPKRR